MTRYRQRQQVVQKEGGDAETRADTPGISPNEIPENQPQTDPAYIGKADKLLALYQEEQPRRHHAIVQRVNLPRLYALTFIW